MKVDMCKQLGLHLKISEYCNQYFSLRYLTLPSEPLAKQMHWQLEENHPPLDVFCWSIINYVTTECKNVT